MRLRVAVAVLSLSACGSVKDDDKPDAPKAADAAVDGSGNVDAAVDAMIDGPMLVVPANPKLWLKFDDTPTDGVLDSASTAHTASCSTAAMCPTLVAGKKGSAYQFSADRIDVLNQDLGPGTGFTIAAWIRLDASTTENSVGVCEAVGSDCAYGLMAAVGNHPGYYGGSPPQTTGTATLALGTWYHTMMIFDGSNRKTYLDGVLVDTQQATFGTAVTKMTIGSRDFPAGSPLNFPGSIDEVLFYDRVLTAAEITLISTP